MSNPTSPHFDRRAPFLRWTNNAQRFKCKCMFVKNLAKCGDRKEKGSVGRVFYCTKSAIHQDERYPRHQRERQVFPSAREGWRGEFQQNPLARNAHHLTKCADWIIKVMQCVY